MKILIKGLLIVVVLISFVVLVSACNKADVPDEPVLTDETDEFKALGEASPTPELIDDPTPTVTPSPSPTAPTSPSETIETLPTPSPSPSPTLSPTPRPNNQGGGQGGAGQGGQSGGNQGGGNSQTPKPSDYVEVTEIFFRTTHSTIAFGETNQWLGQTAEIEPRDATNQTVTYSSSDTSIAFVHDQRIGSVTPVSLGDVTITATSNNGLTASYTLRVFDDNGVFNSQLYIDYAISYGESLGMTYKPDMRRDNSAWDQPFHLTLGHWEEHIKQSTRGRIGGYHRDGFTSFGVDIIHNDEIGYITPRKNTWIMFIYYGGRSG